MIECVECGADGRARPVLRARIEQRAAQKGGCPRPLHAGIACSTRARSCVRAAPRVQQRRRRLDCKYCAQRMPGQQLHALPPGAHRQAVEPRPASTPLSLASHARRVAGWAPLPPSHCCGSLKGLQEERDGTRVLSGPHAGAPASHQGKPPHPWRPPSSLHRGPTTHRLATPSWATHTQVALCCLCAVLTVGEVALCSLWVRECLGTEGGVKGGKGGGEREAGVGGRVQAGRHGRRGCACSGEHRCSGVPVCPCLA